MTDMVENVARAIHFLGCDQDDDEWNHCERWLREVAREQARAAIEAMRSPTDAMKVAGGLKCEAIMFEGEGGGVIFQDMGEVFTAMIDAALSNTREPK